jgi:hypothetical protein
MRYTAISFLSPNFAKHAERYILAPNGKPKPKPKAKPAPPVPDEEELAKAALAEACRDIDLAELTKKAAAYS